MKYLIPFILASTILFGGCAKISPLNPELKQELDNANGKIEELKNNQNGILLELGKIRNQNEMNAQEIKDAQQGLVNLKGSQNSGIQILSGDGGIILLIFIGMIGVLFIYYYRTRAIKLEKTASILAQQIKDTQLEEDVFMAALNTDVEKDVYNIITKNKV